MLTLAACHEEAAPPPPVWTPREFSSHAAAQAGLRPALILGNERVGLPNAIVEASNVLINIPANPAYASLNLSQAAQVLAYECRLATEGENRTQQGVGFQGEHASVAQIDGMYAHLEEALVAIGFLNADNPKKLMPRLKRLFARTQLETEEVNILRGIARQMLRQRRRLLLLARDVDRRHDVAGRRRLIETGGQLRDVIAVAHPDVQLERQLVEQRGTAA